MLSAKTASASIPRQRFLNPVEKALIAQQLRSYLAVQIRALIGPENYYGLRALQGIVGLDWPAKNCSLSESTTSVGHRISCAQSSSV